MKDKSQPRNTATSKEKEHTKRVSKSLVLSDGTEVIQPLGRPVTYEPWMCQKIVEVARRGGHIAAMCEEIGIRSEDTFHRWKRENPDFKAAYEHARLASKAVYEERLLQGALGLIPGFNATAFAMLMNNKFPEEYKREHKASTEITINSLNVSPEQIEYKIAQKMDLLKSMGVDLTSHSTHSENENEEDL